MVIKKLNQSLKKITPFKRVIIGISGGTDSVALAYLLKESGYKVVLAHLNHNLRGIESDKDEKFVKNLAKEWNIPCITKSKKIPKTKNLENNAREIRYKFLEDIRQKYNAKFIAVGHHKDDQVETILMHKERGAGMRGLQGMSYQKGKIIRPLLDISKKEILDFLKKNDIKYRTDESNFDTKYKRNKLRNITIPKLKKENPNFEKTILEKRDTAKKELKIISKKAENWIKKELIDNKFKHKNFSKLDNDLKSEIIIQMLGQKDLYKKNIDELIDFIYNGKTGKIRIIKGSTFSVEYEYLVFFPTVETCHGTSIQEKTKITKKDIIWNDYKISSALEDIYVRSWKEGDRFSPTGMSGSKKVQDFFVDQKVPQNKRKQIPIIVNKNDQILCIANLRYDKKGIKLKNDIKIEKL